MAPPCAAAPQQRRVRSVPSEHRAAPTANTLRWRRARTSGYAFLGTWGHRCYGVGSGEEPRFAVMADLYKIFGVPKDADRHTIQVAYRRLARRHHPDFGGDQEIMAVLNDAWAILGDPSRREQYDATRSRRPRKQAVVTPEPSGPLAAAAERRRPRRDATQETVLDFGRYEGWTIRALAIEDPYYLEWLMRSQAGRMYRAEIVTRLQERSDRESPPVAVKERPKRSRFRRG
jgi:curved DNA-binding protein CbpA